MTRSTYAFTCPNPECEFVALIDWVPDTRWDPGYLDGDPPEDCPSCGADMTGADSERADPNDYGDPDRVFDMDR